MDGTVFDSSVQRGTPASFPLNRVIKRWTEALPLMPTGSKWGLFIPPHLGYGDRQVSAAIDPNSILIFEVELIHIN
ncbi:FKBP-type peptidyl-prolyl cis-trans isomerase [Hydrotalea sp.]|uniref:FKBP-type peptidyl-prolyl cis-trans isomerase n=1 Tax=Hydrotalea sp. TaxID=2881279 RepID=UPI0025847C01|nr:FKBP-type peptidyl-prolyl cis-trans isomerase [Hydrotalea sp.]